MSANNPNAPAFGRPSAAVQAAQLSRARHGATDHANALRVAKLISLRDPGTTTLVHIRKFCEQLPQIVRVERDTALAIAADIDPTDAKSQFAYRDNIERACVLTKWSVQCSFVSTQQACMAIVRRALAGRTP